jgi:hypothetical protein
LTLQTYSDILSFVKKCEVIYDFGLKNLKGLTGFADSVTINTSTGQGTLTLVLPITETYGRVNTSLILPSLEGGEGK